MEGNSDLPVIYDGPLDEPVLERLDQISKKVDGLNKCSISTVQMAKKVYGGLEEVKQVSGNLRAEIGKIHTVSAGLTADLRQTDHDINSMKARVDEVCSALETRVDQLLQSTATEQRQMLDDAARQFLAALVENPIAQVKAALSGVRGLAWAGAVLGLINLVLLILLLFKP